MLFGLRFRTGALVTFFGGRESSAAREILGSPPELLASDMEAAVAMALMGERFNSEGYLSHGYEIHAPSFLGSGFTKRPGTGMAVSFNGADNIFVGMDDHEFVKPVSRDARSASRATEDAGRRILDLLAGDLAAFASEMKNLKVDVRFREFPDRAR